MLAEPAAWPGDDRAVFDALGRWVATLVRGERAQGTHAVEFDAARMPPGAYLYRLTADGVTRTGKMLAVK